MAEELEIRNSKNASWWCALANAHHTRAKLLTRYKDPKSRQARQESMEFRRQYLAMAWKESR